MTDNVANLQAYFTAWKRGDTEAMLDLVHDDIVYTNVPYERVMRGKGDIRKFLGWFAKNMQDYELKLRHIVGVGDVVFHEGWECYTKNGRRVELPYAGVCEFKDGKIIGQRDYFDGAMLARQLGVEHKAA
jgi:steroid delta-isomerase-like uncharacterized protein